MSSQKITIKEASIFAGKSEITIRRLIKSNKLSSQKINGIIYIDKVKLSNIFTLNEPIINDKEENKINQDNILNIQPLLDRLVFFANENEKNQRLLTAGQLQIKEIEESKNKEIRYHIKKNNYLLLIILGLFIVILIMILLFKGFLIINF